MSDIWKLADEELLRKITKEKNRNLYKKTTEEELNWKIIKERNRNQFEKIYTYLANSQPMDQELANILTSNFLSKIDFQTHIFKSLNNINDFVYTIKTLLTKYHATA